MADFDPYHQWLAISPKDQPPTHYRLLGVDLFESNADVIAHAADKQMAHIRSFQTGKHSNLSQKLLNEIATAKICLLNSEKKAVYDQKLRQRAAQLRQQSVTPNVPPVAPSPIAAPRTGELDFLEAPAITPRIIPLAKPKKSSDKNQLWIGGTAAVLLIIVLAFNLGRNGKEVASTEPKPSPTIVAPIKKKPIALKPQDRPEESFKSAEKRVDPSNDSPKEAEKPRAISPKKPAEPTPSTAGNLHPQPDSDPKYPANKFKDPPANTFFPGGEKPKQTSTEEKVEANETAVPPKEDSQPTDVSVKPKEKPPAPAKAEQEKALTTIREIYKDDYRAADQAAFAKKLIQKADESKDDSVARFALLWEAKKVAAGASQGELAFEAIDAMSSEYDVSGSELKAEVLEQATKKTHLTPDHRAAIAKAALQVIDEAIADDNFDIATRMGKQAFQLARLAKDKELIQDIVTKNKEVEAAVKAYAEVGDARATLKEKPNDPDANLIVGKYLCRTKGDWEKGLPMLALGSDAKLRALAEQDIKGATTPEGQVKLGDGWWDSSGKQRARYWYEKAQPGLAGLERDRVEKRAAGLKSNDVEKKGLFTLKQVLAVVKLTSVAYGSSSQFEVIINRRVVRREDSRGLYVVALNRGTVVLNQSYDTHGDFSAANRFAAAISELPQGAIVILVVVDAATQNFNRNAQMAILSIGGRIGLLGKPWRSTYYCVGQKGLSPGMAVEAIGETDLHYPPVKANRALGGPFQPRGLSAGTNNTNPKVTTPSRRKP